MILWAFQLLTLTLDLTRERTKATVFVPYIKLLNTALCKVKVVCAVGLGYH